MKTKQNKGFTPRENKNIIIEDFQGNPKKKKEKKRERERDDQGKKIY